MFLFSNCSWAVSKISAVSGNTHSCPILSALCKYDMCNVLLPTWSTTPRCQLTLLPSIQYAATYSPTENEIELLAGTYMYLGKHLQIVVVTLFCEFVTKPYKTLRKSDIVIDFDDLVL